MCSDSFQLLGMAERGFLPAALAKRSRYGTPTLAIILSSLGILMLVTFDFLQVCHAPSAGRRLHASNTVSWCMLLIEPPDSSSPRAQIVELLNIIYCLAELLEFAAFIRLRITAPDMKRCAPSDATYDSRPGSKRLTDGTTVFSASAGHTGSRCQRGPSR